VDGEIWTTSAQKSTAVQRLRSRGYQSLPLRRVHIPKPGKKTTRPLGIPAMIDRGMQALYLQALEPIAEVTGDRNSYGFRKGRSTHDAIGRCFQLQSKRASPKWILDCDVKSCFDEISHEWLVRYVPMENRVLHKWLVAGFMDKSVFHPTVAGTPQGGIASPVLANMALDGLQRALEERFPRKKGGNRHQVYLVRYADDFIVTGDSPEILGSEVRPIIEAFLAEKGLRLSAEKTVARHVDAGFDFLGMTVRKYRGKMLIKPSKKGVLSFLENVRELIKKHPTITTAALSRPSELFFSTSSGAVVRLAPFGVTSRAVVGA
jgi:RNA-directed DNA polymerase